MSFDWTEAAVGRLQTMWRAGASATAVATELGTSRSAVIGKVRRLGMSGRVTIAAVALGKPPRGQAAPSAPLEGREPVGLLELGASACRWPLGGDADNLMCCGARAEEGRPYCGEHLDVAHPSRRRGSRLKAFTERDVARWEAAA